MGELLMNVGMRSFSTLLKISCLGRLKLISCFTSKIFAKRTRAREENCTKVIQLHTLFHRNPKFVQFSLEISQGQLG